jgi:hypothetical protein
MRWLQDKAPNQPCATAHCFRRIWPALCGRWDFSRRSIAAAPLSWLKPLPRKPKRARGWCHAPVNGLACSQSARIRLNSVLQPEQSDHLRPDCRGACDVEQWTNRRSDDQTSVLRAERLSPNRNGSGDGDRRGLFREADGTGLVPLFYGYRPS